MNTTTAEVMIVGAGPVGLTTAAELARYGVSCRVIDKAAGPSPTSKALAIFPRTLEVFAQMGVVNAVLQAGHRLHGLSGYAAGRRRVHLSFGTLESPYPFVISLPQSATERLLSEQARGLGVAVEWQTELTGFTQDEQGVTVTLRRAEGEDERVTASWLIGCDGAHSTVRHTLGLPFTGARYEDTLVLADVALRGAVSEDEASLFFHSDGILGVFPFGAGRYRLVVDLPPGAATANQPEPTLAELQALVEQRGQPGTDVSDPTWVSRFHIARRKVERFRAGRVFLAGDAAHIHSPVGGQGMNTGIQDAHNLAWKLALVIKRQTPLSLLDSYTAEREPVARHVLQLTDWLTRMATLRQPLVQRVRNFLLPVAAGVPLVEHRIAETMAELAVSYRRSPVVAEHWDVPFLSRLRTSPAAGDRAPDGPLRTATAGAPTSVFEVMRGTRHTLLLFGGLETNGALDPLLIMIGHEVGDTYGQYAAVHIVSAHDKGQRPSVGGGSVLQDLHGVVHRRYGAATPCCYLIRPDGYIGFRCRPPQRDRIRDYLRTIFAASGSPATDDFNKRGEASGAFGGKEDGRGDKL